MPHIEPSTVIDGVVIVRLQTYPDDRGRLLETYRHEWLPGTPPMIQATRSDSKRGVVRALHFHRRQADYWYVPVGRLFAALYDLRRSSPTRGAALTIEMADDIGLYIPKGVAHGFQALTDATLTYLVDRYHDPDDENGIAYNDAALGIDWPIADAILSDRDRNNPKLADIPESELPA